MRRVSCLLLLLCLVLSRAVAAQCPMGSLPHADAGPAPSHSHAEAGHEGHGRAAADRHAPAHGHDHAPADGSGHAPAPVSGCAAAVPCAAAAMPSASGLHGVSVAAGGDSAGAPDAAYTSPSLAADPPPPRLALR